MRRPAVACLVLAAAAGARAQTMLDQEERLIEVHSLLVDMGSLNAPGAYRNRDLSLGVEVIVIPPIDGTTGGKRQITASDRTPIFPRLRVALGLPAPEGFRASVGIAYIPPIRLGDVSSHFAALEAEMAYAPGPLAVALHGHVLLARSMGPVTEPATRDTLDNFELGANAAAGYRFDFAPGSVTPYASIGLTRAVGIFRVTSDGYELTSRTTNPVLGAGVRLLAKQGVELVAELTAFPGRLVHPSFRVAWMPDWLSRL
ncbi:MAG: hypothetical protein ACJ79H_21080 [Myxococcales bacterium]